MPTLSTLVDTQLCGDADTAELDDILGLGSHMAEPGSAVADIATLARWETDGAQLKSSPGFVAPRGVPRGTLRVELEGLEVVNDLYAPGVRLEDGVAHVYFPVSGAPRSTEAIITDYAFLLMAATVVQGFEQRVVIFEAWWPDGRVVRGVPEAPVWKALRAQLRRAQTKQPRQAGPSCARCLRRNDCPNWAALDDILTSMGAPKVDPKLEAQRLWLDWVLMRTLESKVESRRKHIAERLGQLAVNGVVDVNGILKLNITSAERTSYDIEQVLAILQPAGLWKSAFGAVRVGELHKALAAFPPAVQGQLNRVAKTEKVAPSIREAAAGTERAVGRNIFFGVA